MNLPPGGEPETATSAPGPRRIVLDTDPGVDDALALLLAAASPELEVAAILTVAGNVPLATATDNARRILPIAWEGRVPPPLCCGAAREGETAEQVHGSDGLGWATTLRDEAGRDRYPALAELLPAPADEYLLELAAEHPGQITLVTLGPLTNAAAAFRRDPDRFGLLREVVVMGGAFREIGNVSPLAEFNIYVDPEAAQAVCESGVPLSWIPLDVTHQCLLRPHQIAALPGTRRSRFVQEIVGVSLDFHQNVYGERACFPHDAVAVGSLIWPELFRYVRRRVDVETASPLCRGLTVADFRPEVLHRKGEPNGRVCTAVGAEAFLARFLARLA